MEALKIRIITGLMSVAMLQTPPIDSFSGSVLEEESQFVEPIYVGSVVEYHDALKKLEELKPVEPAKVIPEIKPEKFSISDEDIDLIALVTMAEAEGESVLGKRLVIDTILNRKDSKNWPNTVYGVVYQKAQFTSMWNGRVDRCYIRDDIRKLVLEELRHRTNYEVVFFMAGKYSRYGTPLFREGNHYFSKI